MDKIKTREILKYIVFILLLFIIYKFANYIFSIYKNNQKENYLTYFIPYYNQKYTQFPDYRNFKYSKIDNLRIGHITEDKEYSDFIGKMLIGTTNLLKVSSIDKDYEYQIIDDLVNDKLDVGIVSVSNLKEYMKKANYEKLSYISYSYNNFLYLICRSDIIFENMDDIFNYKMSIGRDKGKTNTFCKFFLKKLFRNKYENLNLEEEDADIAINQLINNEIDILCYFSYFPSKRIKSWLDNNKLKLFYIHPIKLSSFQKKIVYEEDKTLSESYLDLNLISKKYLPVYISKNLYYTKFKPILETVSSYNILICRRALPNNVTYSLGALFYFNNRLIKKTLGKEMAPSQRLFQYSYIGTIQIHPGVYDFLTRVGFAKNSENKCFINYKQIPCNQSIEVEREKNRILPFKYELEN